MTTLRHTPARTILVELICDCGTAMEWAPELADPYAMPTFHNPHPHHCRSCGRNEVKDRPYPYYAHEPIGETK